MVRAVILACGLFPVIAAVAHADGVAGVWLDGWIYDPDSGDTYRATLALRRDGTLAVRGYVGIPLFGRTETWTRPRRTPTACAAR